MIFASVRTSSLKIGLKPVKQDFASLELHPVLHKIPPLYNLAFFSQ